MAKKKETTEEKVEEVKPTISPLTEQFNIADLNTLRDKINEIIKEL